MNSKMDRNENRILQRGKMGRRCMAFILAFALIFTTWGPDLSVLASYNTSSLDGGFTEISSGGVLGFTASSQVDDGYYESIDTAYFTVQGTYADTVNYTANLYINNTSSEVSDMETGVLATTVTGSQAIEAGSAGRTEIAVDFGNSYYAAAGENFAVEITVTFSTNTELYIFSYSGDGYGALAFDGSDLSVSEDYLRLDTTTVSEANDTTVTLSAEKTAIATGDSTTLTATLSPAYSRDVSYTTAGSLVTVNESGGSITATAGSTSGTETITATVGNNTSTVTMYVLSAALDATNYSYTGDAIEPGVTVTCGDTLTKGTNYDVTYSDNVNPGTATVTITGKGIYADYSQTLNFTIGALSITGNVSISAATIDTSTSEVTAANITYTSPTDSTATTALEINTDYTIQATQKSTNASGITYALTITGMGGYTGTDTSLTYTVAPSTSSLVDISAMYDASLATTTYEYTKSAIQPDPSGITFYYKGTSTEASLTMAGAGTSADVIYAYGTNTDVGTGTITLTGVAAHGYTGTITLTFAIEENEIATTALTSSTDLGHVTFYITDEDGNVTEYDKDSQLNFVHSGSAINPNITATVYNGSTTTSLEAGTDFSVTYSNATDIGQATITVNGLGGFSGSYNMYFNIIGDLENDARIYFTDGSYVSPTNGEAASNYSEVYDGSACTGVIKQITMNNVKLSVTAEGSTSNGYYLTYSNNTDAGTATVTIYGTGIYDGMVDTVTFAITSRPFTTTTDNVSISTTSKTYTGSAITLTSGSDYDVVVSLGGTETTLTENTDYTVSYSNNKDVGTATITVTGTGNYSGTLTGTYSITALDLSNFSSSNVTYTSSYAYTGSAITLTDLTLTYNGLTIDSNNYSVSYANNVNVASATDTAAPTATITGTNNLSGTYTAKFTISAKTVSSATITAGGKATTAYNNNAAVRTTTYSKAYTGATIRPAITVKDGSTTLKAGTDYTVSYSNNVNAGSALDDSGTLNTSAPCVKLTGKGNYAGSEVLVYYTITQRDISTSSITVTDNVVADAATNPTLDSNGKYIPSDTEMVLTDVGVSTIELVKDTDYTVLCTEGGTTAGEGNVVTITGTGNYTGTRTVSYIIGEDISSGTATLIKPSDGTTYAAKTSEGLYDIYYLGASTRPGYSLTYSGSELATYDYTTKTQSTDGVNITYDAISGSLMNDGAYAAGSTVYVTATADTSALKYYGSVTIGYYIEQLDIGDSTVALTSAGAAAGYSADSDATSNTSFSVTYNGSDLTPDGTTLAITSSLGDQLTYGTDYTISNSSSSATNAGTYTITITGKGSYAGTLELTLTVNKADLSDCISIAESAVTDGTLATQVGNAAATNRFVFTQPDDVIYTGSAVRFTVYAWDTKRADSSEEAGYHMLKSASDGLAWTTDAEGTTTFTTVTTPGTYDTYLVALASSNYTGYIPITVTVEQRVISSSTITLDPSSIPDQSYDGTAKTPLDSYSVIYTSTTDSSNKTTLTAGTDYTVSYTDNTNPGKATVTITAATDSEYYSGSYTTTFNIYGDISSDYYTKSFTPSDNATYLLDNSGSLTNFKSLITNKISVTDYSGNALTAGTDYTITLEDSYGNTATSASDTGLKAGEATIYLTGVGSSYLKGTYKVGTINLTGDLSQATVTLSRSVYYYTGSNITVNPTVKLDGVTLTQGTDYYVLYSDSSTDGVTDVGTYGITIIAMDGATSFTGQVTLDNAFTVKYNLSAATVTLTPTSFIYDGTDKKDAVSVVVTIGDKELSNASDYVLSYPSSDYTTVGTKTITVTTSDATTYSVGSKSATFTIGSADLTDTTASVTLTTTSYTYTGAAIIPEVSVKYGTTTLTQNTDYTMTVSNNVNVADASDSTAPTVVVTGIGNYTGTVSLTFSITQAQISDTVYVTPTIASSVDFAGVGNAVLPDYSFMNVATGAALVEGTDFTVSTPTSTTNFAAGTDVATVIFTGIGNYSGQITHTYTISPINLATSATVSIAESSAVYTGDVITPAITVTVPINGSDEDYTLQQGTDYTISYSETIRDAGSYTITINGNGTNFINSRSITFTVTPRTLLLTNTDITATVADQDYTGSAITLTDEDITVQDIGVSGYSQASPYTLVLGTDYTITSYNNNTLAGEAGSSNGPTVTITGTGNYTGARVLEFNIGESLSDAVVAVDPSVYTYDGTEKKPSVTATLDGELLDTAAYNVAYETDTIHRTWDEETSTSSGEKVVTITGSGVGYYGTATGTYTIQPKQNVSSSNIVIKFKDNTNDDETYTMTYTGAALEPEVEVYDTEISATEPMETYDYSVSYSNNTESTSSDNLAYVIISLQNDYNTTDSTVYTKGFAISPQEISEEEGYALSVVDNDEDGLNDGRYHWTGSAITPEVVLKDPDGNVIPQTETVTAADGTEKTVTNYTVTYTGVSNDGTASPINSGTAVATVTGSTNYGGSISTSYIIYSSLSAANSGTGETTISIPEQFYYGATGETRPTPTPSVESGGNTLESGTNFTTTYTYNDEGTEGYALITPIADGTNNYYTGSYTYTFAINNSIDNLTVNGIDDVYLYDGETHDPLKDGNVTITTPSGASYTYDYDAVTFERLSDSSSSTYESTTDLISAGTIRATIPVQIGSDTVDITASYIIQPKNISSADITVVLIEKDYYNGRNLTPYPTVFYDTDTDDDTNELIELKRGTDYTLSYANNLNPGQAAVAITGTGNYTNSRTEYFSIVPAEPASLSATAVSSTSIQVSWKADSRVDGYVIYSVDGTKYTQIGTTTNNTYAVTGLTSSTTYTFGVASYVTADGNTTYSTPHAVSATTTVSTPASSAVSNASKKATITLGANAGESVKIYRSTSRNGTYTQIATIPASKMTYTDSGLTSGKTYYYKTQAYRQIDGTWYGSSLSSPFSVTVK